MSDHAEVIFVDDDPHILATFERVYFERFNIATFENPAQLLDELEQYSAAKVIVADMRMPQMNGTELLRQIRDRRPDMQRILLTGQAELSDAAEAVNSGGIHKFLLKPCPQDELAEHIQACIQAYEATQIEHVVLSTTLHATVATLSDVLCLASPEASGVTERLKAAVTFLLQDPAIEADPQVAWTLHAAAALSQIGQIGREAAKTKADRRDVAMASAKIISRIPRLEQVALMVRNQYGFSDQLGDLGAIRGAILLQRIHTQVHDLAEIAAPTAAYAKHPKLEDWVAIVDAQLQDFLPTDQPDHRVNYAALRPGMMLAADILTDRGVLVLPRGHEFTQQTIDAVLRMVDKEQLPRSASFAINLTDHVDTSVSTPVAQSQSA
nr:response regulator [Oceanococcus sp. HetDA_MAG_MS8]